MGALLPPHMASRAARRLARRGTHGSAARCGRPFIGSTVARNPQASRGRDRDTLHRARSELAPVQRFAVAGSPYRLYALANAASLSALLAYPILIEPTITLAAQWTAWKALYVVFSLQCALAVWRSAERPPAVPATARFDPLWIALPAAGTAALMATTNQMCQEIAAVPFLWILPLALYLTSFVLAFDHRRWYHRRAFALLAALAIPAACGLSVIGLNHVSLPAHLAVYSLALFCGLMLCHGELAAREPDPGTLSGTTSPSRPEVPPAEC